MQKIIRLPVVLALAVGSIAAQLQQGYRSFAWTVDGADYWAPTELNTQTYNQFASSAGVLPQALDKRAENCDPSPRALPCTVITITSAGPITEEKLSGILDSYGKIDDVWTPAAFLQCVYLQIALPEVFLGKAQDSAVTLDKDSLTKFCAAHSVQYLFTPQILYSTVPQLPAVFSPYRSTSNFKFDVGPYVASFAVCGDFDLTLVPAFRIYTDSYEAFMEGSTKDTSNAQKHSALQFTLPGKRLPGILVPSRLGKSYLNPGPLAGLRFAVKDTIHVNGMKTSAGSRAYYATYGAQNYTTDVVQKLLDAGASFVGKTKTTAFSLSSHSNGREVDYLDPWNARGDGYQTTGGTSSGSGAAVTAYDWVDFAIGSDTGGDTRIPARHGGLYAYKPTFGVFNATGLLVSISDQDTPAFLARSPSIFSKVGRLWAKGTSLEKIPTAFPKNIQYLQDQFTPLAEPAAETLKLAFFKAMATALGMTTTTVDLTKSWNKNDVTKGLKLSISDYMQFVYSDQNSIELWNEVGKPLVAQYGLNNNGAFPPVDPVANLSFTDALNPKTIARLADSKQRRINFANWYNTAIVPASKETCSESIIAHSIHVPADEEKVQGSPVALSIPGYWDTVSVNYAGIPEIVVPIAQYQYFSPYTRKFEFRPLTVAFQAAKGCDLVLFELVDKLAEKGLIKEVLPGKVAYPV